jgi:hypothetical protein
VSHGAAEAKLLTAPCPRCGCYVAKHFDCNCGAVHDDYCINCGRWVSLPSDQYTTLTELDEACEKGAVLHEHSDEEKKHRLDAFYARVRTETVHPEGKG